MTLALCSCGPKDGDDWAAIEKSGALKVGYTEFAPMNYVDDNGVLIGFETEFAQAVCEKLGLEAEFVKINWDSKQMELESRNIDCIWNGMTITPELSEAMSISDPYIKNYQVVVVRAAEVGQFKTTADFSDKKLEAEAGSAGEKAVQGDENLAKASYTPVPKQTDALLEVKTGAADACVLDFVLAEKINGAMEELIEDGTLGALAEKYELSDLLLANQK